MRTLHVCVVVLSCLLAFAVGCDDDPGVATACDADEDCETGLCYTASNPGYCTAACENEGETAGCPADTVCKPIQGGPARCLLICEEDADCPGNSDCADVSDSDFDACEPIR